MWILLYHIGHVNWPCKGNERKSTCSGCMGEPGQLPTPSPSSVTRSRWGGGGEMAGRVLFGDPEQGRGVTLASQTRELESHLILARKICGLESHLSSASYFGKSFRQVIWASLSGTSIWRGFIASNSVNIQWVFGMKLKQEKKSKLCIFREPVMSHHRHCI